MKARSIKVINEQTNYKKWEFVYDMRKDNRMLKAVGQAQNAMMSQQPNMNGMGQQGGPGQQPGFGQPGGAGQQAPFGQQARRLWPAAGRLWPAGSAASGSAYTGRSQPGRTAVTLAGRLRICCPIAKQTQISLIPK